MTVPLHNLNKSFFLIIDAWLHILSSMVFFYDRTSRFENDPAHLGSFTIHKLEERLRLDGQARDD